MTKLLVKTALFFTALLSIMAFSFSVNAAPVPFSSVTYTWNEGAFAGGQYKLSFPDGKVKWIGLKVSEKGHTAVEDKVTILNLGDDRYLITWLEEVGYTVTEVLNIKSGTVKGVVSNQKEHYVLHGTIDEIKK